MENFHGLLEGFQNFKTKYYIEDRDFYSSLQGGQNPQCLLIACCDSRVDPAILLRCKPGDLFVVRNVAALVPSSSDATGPSAVMAAVEYGIKHLGIRHIVVMGHSNCGGIAGLLNPEKIEKEKHIRKWLAIAEPTLHRLDDLTHEESKRVRYRHCEEGAVLLSINNLLSYDWIRERVECNTLELHALYFDLGEANLYRYNKDKEDFELLFDHVPG